MGLLSLLNLEFAPKRLVLKFENNSRGGTVSKSQFKTNQSIQIDVCNRIINGKMYKKDRF